MPVTFAGMAARLAFASSLRLGRNVRSRTPGPGTLLGTSANKPISRSRKAGKKRISARVPSSRRATNRAKEKSTSTGSPLVVLSAIAPSISLSTCATPALCTPQRAAMAVVLTRAYVAGLTRKKRPRACGTPSNLGLDSAKTGARGATTPPFAVSTHAPTANEPSPGRDTPLWFLSCAKMKSQRPSHAWRHCSALMRMRRQ